jgi:hypothetical protein
MANTRISQLPSYTGTAADLRWFVMNNSGETTTYKYSGYTSPYKVVGTDNSNNIYDTTAMVGTFSSIVGGKTNTISSTGVGNGIFGGTGNTISGGYYQQSTGAIVGGKNNTITDCQLDSSGILAGENNTISGRGYSGIIGGFANQVGGWACFAGGYGTNTPAGNELCFNYGNQTTILSSNFAVNLGGSSKTINTSNYSSMLGGGSNGMTNTNYSSMIGGNNNTMTGGTHQVMLGTSGRTADYDHTTFVENIHAYRTPSTEVQPVFSGSVFTCNLDLGAKSQFYITGTSTINITNVRDGASFMIKTQTDGNYNMTWTATGGYTFVFEGGIKDPGNNVIDIFQFEVFGSVIYGSRKHNFS